jgi:hypothetical protein
MKIYKYELPASRGVFKRAMSQIQYTMHVEAFDGKAFMWASVDEKKEQVYEIHALHTGDDVPDWETFLKIGTAIFDGGNYVLHYYRKAND